MTVDEYEAKLQKLSNKEYEEFESALGGDPVSKESRVKDFVHHPEWERRICFLLKLNTEADKLTAAGIASASAAVESAISAKWSLFVAILACVVSIAAAVVAFLMAT